MPGRTRHPLPDATWPTREQAAASPLFAPLALTSRVTLVGRTWVPAMVPWRATEDGQVTDRVIDWYRRFAEGGPAVIVVEATGIRDVPSGPLLRIGHDRFVPGLTRLVEAVREASGGRTRLLIQLIDFLTIRRRPRPETFFRRFAVVDAGLRERLARRVGDERLLDADEAEVRERLVEGDDVLHRAVLSEREYESLTRGYRERVTDTHLSHVASLPAVLPGLFAEAAARAQESGFDGVELHYAHAYTMASFLSRLNTRQDGYGDTRPGRVRLPLEVYEAVRARVGPSYPVGCRFLGDEVIAGGSDVEDAAWFGRRFAEAGMDFLSVSKGGKFEDAKAPRVGQAIYPYTGRSGHECMPTVFVDAPGPFGRNVPLAAHVRRAVREAGHETPVVAAGGIATFELADRILREGHADLVASARQSLADPDWWRKMREGRGDEIRRCVFTNYCEALDQRHLEVTCQLWDREFGDDEDAVPRSADGRRRLTAPAWRR